MDTKDTASNGTPFGSLPRLPRASHTDEDGTPAYSPSLLINYAREAQRMALAAALAANAEVLRLAAVAVREAGDDEPVQDWQDAALKVCRAVLAAATAAPAAARYPLPDDLYAGSKDWLDGDYAQRVWWLHVSYESVKAERDELLRQLAQAGAQEAQPQT